MSDLRDPAPFIPPTPKRTPAAASPLKPARGGELSADLVIIGAGPAGSAAAFHAARTGMDVLVVDMADMLASPRDKTCGDGLTPRAVAALEAFGPAGRELLEGRPHIRGLKLHGFGGSVTAPWPEHGAFPTRGSAVARVELDAALLRAAVDAGARFEGGIKATGADTGAGARAGSGARAGAGGSTGSEVVRAIEGVRDGQPVRIRCRQLLLAEGVRSGVARQLGVEWRRGLVHGVAARSYVRTPAGTDEWIHSHLELRSADGVAQPGYGWMFPLGAGEPGGASGGVGRANLGCGALATSTRPAGVNTKKLLLEYAESVRDLWSIEGQPQNVKSALLPMGGAVTRVAGRNWACIGDAAALVNPLNGEGIDYALESARLVVPLLSDAQRNPHGLLYQWPALLRKEYGDAFSLARRLAMVLTMPGLLAAIGPVGMRGPWAQSVMGTAARLMGNLVTPEDRDVAGRLWLGAGRLSRGVDRVLAADARPLFGRT
ncbi:geranylgeranyl reductase family protein [Corynebacterium sp. 319]|nr:MULTISPECIES: geranylgeranyl reductase family protein [unclassified Corynebacterium]KAB1554265.1 geranylgeranyl reductase family protein [Corynebacterium sp. 319]KAB3539991.1 geranylgeranyl reductase family protein [Corynebacterium sp. 366]